MPTISWLQCTVPAGECTALRYSSYRCYQSPLVQQEMTAITVDPTVADPVQKAQIQQYYGISLDHADKEALAFIVDRSRHAGNQAFKDKRYAGEVSGFSLRFAQLCCRSGSHFTTCLLLSRGCQAIQPSNCRG